jgi:CheY-like chemotaxis protein
MILVVDDDPQVGVALCRLCKAIGYPSRGVTSAAEALAIIRSHPAGTPLLVLLDETMPDMAGVEFLRVLRSDAATEATPVIMHSASRDEAKRDVAVALGALAWLPKGGGPVGETIRAVTEWYERIGGQKQRRDE